MGKDKKSTISAGGIGALKASAQHVLKHRCMDMKAFLRVNQPHGFDCPGCAWPEPKQASKLEFCENGIKALAHEMTAQRANRKFFRSFSVSHLRQQSDYWLEQQGRLTEPMKYDSETDHYVPISWQAAFAEIGAELKALDDANQAVFYTSGRTSNEAAFLYQLFGRRFGTNNFPDCSNMCHESSGVALGEAIGIGKGTVTLEDFSLADAIFILGQNPGTNHPRMLAELQAAAGRGCQIVSVNPLKEPGLMRFIHPKHAGAMLTGKASPLSSLYLQPVVGGDLALLKGLMKRVFEQEREVGQVLARNFIQEHTTGFVELEADIEAVSWQNIESQSGLSRQAIEEAADIYITADRTIICWAMGLTQQKQAVGTLQQVINLLLLRGNLGKPGAGACPVRGHSNVQGDRTMGIVEAPKESFLQALETTFDFKPPRQHGHNTVQAIRAMAEGRVQVFICMGGNFAAATPDTGLTAQALGKVDLNVQISTKLNRSHLVFGKNAIILPCLGRTERDEQATGLQSVTVEDSMSSVHASRGHRRPASPDLKSEPAIVAGLALATLGKDPVDWQELVDNYDRIRDLIAKVLPAFGDFNQRIREPGGFYLGNSARERRWLTATEKAGFFVHPLPENRLAEGQIRLMTVRSHDQFNTTIYGLDDRYRGIRGRRMVVFLNEDDMRARNLKAEDEVELVSQGEDGLQRKAKGFAAIPYDIPRGCAAAYFPETNVLVPIDAYASRSFTPASKFIPVWVHKKSE